MPIPSMRNSQFQTRRLDSQERSVFSSHKFTISEPPRHRKSRRFRPKKLLNSGFRLFLVCFLVGAIFLVGAFAWYSRDLPDPNKIIERDVAQSTKIYDRTGENLLYEIHGDQRRTLIDIDTIPRYAVDATIAIEDKNFFKHSGISIWGILRGLIMPSLRGERVQGGSTLTQQFVKNSILTNERSISRKIREWILSYRIEKKFTKEEILKLYFNEIPYGAAAYGIESASGIYFGKSAKDLTLGEATILAALPQAPSYYSPFGPHKDELMQRQKLVLDLMVEQGYITKAQADDAKAEQLVFKKRTEDIKAPHFVFMVQQLLADKYGERLVEQGGLKIITTIDWDKQKQAEQIVNDKTQELMDKYQASNAALVTIDVATGEILALIGSRDYFNSEEIDGQFNVATSPRQPGSSLKPLVYAEAFSKGYSPDTLLFDLNTSFAASGKDYRPRNYDLKEHGIVSMRQALAGSLNIPAVKTLYLAGVNEAVKRGQSMGYSTLTDPDRYGLSLVLGGAEVSLLEHTNAYATFARDGVFMPYTAVLKVEDSEGKVLEEKKDVTQKRVFDSQVARQINSVLSDNSARAFIFGENNYLTLGGRPVAAKTGTTNDYKDAWLLGYTPQIVTGVWVGNNDNKEMTAGSGAMAAGPIWNTYMRAITQSYPALGFPTPTPTACDKLMVCGKKTEPLIVRIDKATGSVASESTPANQIEEKKYWDIHDILFYVKRNDPLGSAPENPADDPQYSLWESPIKKWLEDQGYIQGLAPGQTADSAMQPVIAWQIPANGQTINDSPMTLEVSAQAKLGINKIDFYLDNQFLGSSTSQPYSLIVPAQSTWQNGSYNLKAIAYDTLGNAKAESIQINLNLAKSDINISANWVAPVPSENYTLAKFPGSLIVSIDKPDKLKKVDFYASVDNQTKWLGFVENPKETTLSVDYKPTETGLYKFYLVMTDIYGKIKTTDQITVNIK